MNSAAKLDLKEGLRLHRGVYNRMIEGMYVWCGVLL